MAKSPRSLTPVPMDDYQAQSDADHLMRAEEIRGDEDRHNAALKHVRRRFHTAARAMTANKPKGTKKTGGVGRFTAAAKLGSLKPKRGKPDWVT